VAGCSLGKLWDSQERVCEDCIDNCWTCDDLTTCRVCVSGYMLLADQTCSLNCPAGFYEDEHRINCLACDANCEHCTGNLSTQCTSCYSGTYLLESECVAASDCLEDQFANDDDNT
jgi:proprotein convertase subtilisin/kexin type 5